MRAFFLSLLMAILVPASLGPFGAGFVSPASARDDDDDNRSQRAEAQRQRQEAQRQRQEAQRQRQEAQAQAQAQRDAARQLVRSSKQDSSSQSSAGNSQRNTSSSQQSSSDDDDGDTSGRSSNSSSKQGASGKNNNKNANNNKDKEKDNSDDGDSSSDDSAALPEPEAQPPRTLVDWWKNVTGGNAPASASSNSPKAQTNNTGRNERDDGRAQQQGKDGGDADSKKTATVQNKPETGANAGASSGGVKLGAGFDKALMDLGGIRKRQILASGLDASSAEKATAMGFKTIATSKSPAYASPVLLLAVPSGMSEEAAQRRLAGAFPSGRFGPNHVYRIYPSAEEGAASSPAANAPQGCAGPECFAKRLINWNKPVSACAENVRIGVIDTSFDRSHPFFAGHDLSIHADFRKRALSPKDDWHGTAVLSILAGNSQSATPGLVPKAQFALASTFGADNNGTASADALAVVSALAWLDGKADIINMSFSGPSNAEIQGAIKAMAAKGVIFVAAGGNQGAYGPASYPAAYPEVIAVTAVRLDSQSYSHATHGDYIDLAAPGVDVYTALPMGQAGLRTGTSFAAPFVTALIAAMPGARKGIRDKYDLLARISKTDLGAPGRDPTFGEGLPIAPKSCDEIGGVASLPWTPEGKRLQQPPPPPAVTGSLPVRNSVPAGSTMGSAFGFSQ